MKIDRKLFGTIAGREGHPNTDVPRFCLTNRSGASIGVSAYGATLLEVIVPDRGGKLANVNLVFPSLQNYLTKHPYFGATVGRYANRIGGAAFTIDGETFSLDKNHGNHTLHGGNATNFTHQLWQCETSQDDDAAEIRLSMTSPSGQNGFPGTVDVTCVYRWNDANELTIAYSGRTDAATHLSMTNHSYFNLGGVSADGNDVSAGGNGNIKQVLDHVLTMPSSEILTVDDELIPHGGTTPVDGTPFDFRTPRRIGDRIDELPATKGYDHCYVVPGNLGELRPAASVVDPASGRTLQCETTLPGNQLYIGNNLKGDRASGGYRPYDAFCLETQMYPNSPNVDSFPSTLIRPGQTMSAQTVYRFGVAE